MTNTQKAFRLIGTVWALSIVPAPIHAQGPWVVATEFHNPSNFRIERRVFMTSQPSSS